MLEQQAAAEGEVVRGGAAAGRIAALEAELGALDAGRDSGSRGSSPGLEQELEPRARASSELRAGGC